MPRMYNRPNRARLPVKCACWTFPFTTTKADVSMAKYATTVRCAETGYTEASLKARATKYQMSARAPTSSRAQSHSPTRPTSCQQVLPHLPTNTTALRTTTTPRMPTLRSRTTTVVQPQAPTQAQAPLPRKLPPGSHGIPPHPVYHHRPPPYNAKDFNTDHPCKTATRTCSWNLSPNNHECRDVNDEDYGNDSSCTPSQTSSTTPRT